MLGVELAAALALRAGEFAEKVFIYAPEHVLGLGHRFVEADVADDVHESAEPDMVFRFAKVPPMAFAVKIRATVRRGVEAGPGVIAWQDAFERGILAFNRAHRIVNDFAKLCVKIERGTVGLYLIGFSHDMMVQVCGGNPAASIPGCVLSRGCVALRSILNLHNVCALQPDQGPVDNSRAKPIEMGFSLRKK
jgi:hypothetical protein